MGNFTLRNTWRTFLKKVFLCISYDVVGTWNRNRRRKIVDKVERVGKYGDVRYIWWKDTNRDIELEENVAGDEDAET